MPNLYRVELNLFNITPGIPGKPYTINDYNIAQQNIVGINNAISYDRKQLKLEFKGTTISTTITSKIKIRNYFETWTISEVNIARAGT